MKICFIGEFPLPNQCPKSGPENVLYNLVSGIHKLDSKNNITILTIHNEIKTKFVSNVFFDVKVHYFPNLKFLPRSLGDPILVTNFIKKYNFDLVHAHYPIAFANLLNRDIPKILTLHGIFYHEKKFVKNPLIRFVYHDYNIYMLKKILPKVDGFVAISPYVLDVLREMDLLSKIKNIFQINNPIDRCFFSVVSNPIDNTILYPATVTELKNQISAVSAIKFIKNDVDHLKLILVGNSNKSYLQKILKISELDNCSHIVEYIGLASREKMLDLYRKSSIVYLLSYQEVQPLVILEAMATGTPVIASNLRSISYIIENGVTGYLVNPDDPEEIAKYTERLLSDRKKQLEIGGNAKKIAQNKYSSEAIARQTLEMYQKILNLKR